MTNNTKPVHFSINDKVVGHVTLWRNARKRLDELTRDMPGAKASIYDNDGRVREYIRDEEAGLVMKERCLPAGIDGSTESLLDAIAHFSGPFDLEESLDAVLVEQALKKQIPMPVTEIHTDEYFCPLCHAEIGHCEDGVITDKFCPQCGQRLETYPKVEV